MDIDVSVGGAVDYNVGDVVERVRGGDLVGG